MPHALVERGGRRREERGKRGKGWECGRVRAGEGWVGKRVAGRERGDKGG